MVLVPPGYTPSIIETPVGDPAQRYAIDAPFFLYPAITYPHKNHLTLVRAFKGVVDRHPDALLVLTSGEAQMEEAVRAEVRRLGLESNVRRLGRVPRGDVDWLLQHAVAVTLPSRFEGFGMPALEAMALGCPVIASDNTAFPEVVGSAGLLLDPDDTEEWTKAMLALLEDADRRAALVAAGHTRIASFPWDESVARLLDVYRRAASAS
jgi:alpha-1,3-rhamnosyl/mannosyltransferase